MPRLPPFLPATLHGAAAAPPPPPPVPPTTSAHFTHDDSVSADAIIAPARADMLPSALTLYSWIRIPSGTFTAGATSNIAQYFDTVAGQASYEFFVTSDSGVPFIGALLCDDTQATLELDAGDVSDTAAFNLALSWDGSMATLFLNGNIIDSQPFVGPLWPGSGDLSTDNFGINNALPGGTPVATAYRVSSLQVYDVALTQTDIQKLIGGVAISDSPIHNYALASDATDTGAGTTANGVAGANVTFGAL